MQNDPLEAKEYTKRLKDVESAVKEDNAVMANTKQQASVGANLDVKV